MFTGGSGGSSPLTPLIRHLVVGKNAASPFVLCVSLFRFNICLSVILSSILFLNCLLISFLFLTFSHGCPLGVEREGKRKRFYLGFLSMLSGYLCIFHAVFVFPVRDRVRTKMERDILVEVNHPFIVKLHYGESANNSRPR